MHPAVLGKDKAVQVFTEVFHHIVTLGLAVHQHVQTQTFLLDDRLFDVFRNAGAVVIRIQIALLKSRRRPRISVVCGKEPMVVVGHAGRLKRARWASARTSYGLWRWLSRAVMAARRFSTAGLCTRVE